MHVSIRCFRKSSTQIYVKYHVTNHGLLNSLRNELQYVYLKNYSVFGINVNVTTLSVLSLACINIVETSFVKI